MSSFTTHPSSFRDPSGFLFYHEGILYRQVNRSFKENFDRFINSGLYQQLVTKHLLIPHQTINNNFTGSSDWYLTLQPQPLPFISYPCEWCFHMLKDAALLTLEAAKEAMNFGLMLKDASSYNVQWNDGRMMFIDTLSFERYEEQKPWVAYRQFCEHFFAPLALMHYLKEPLQNFFLSWPDGIPLTIAKKLLPFKSKFNLHTYLHLHLQASFIKKAIPSNQKVKPFSKQRMKNLLQSLEETIRSFSLKEQPGIWSEYYKEASQRENYLSAKKQIIGEWMNQLKISTVLDAGANEGAFSELMQDRVKYIISTDSDHSAVTKLYKRCKEKGIKNIHPLIIDLANPSPPIGLNNRERISFLNRTRVDLVLALALIHHLAIGRNIPFSGISKMFCQLGKYLIIEYVPKEDEKIKTMLNQKSDVYAWYTMENFEHRFSVRFRIIDKKEIASSKRVLYLMEAYGAE